MADRILKASVEQGLSADAIAAEGIDRSLVESVVARTAANAFQRALEPPYPGTLFYQ